MGKKETLYILFINDLTQLAIVVGKENRFSLRTMEQIIDHDKFTEYKAVTKEQRYSLYCEFIKNNPDQGLSIGRDGSIYKKLYDISSEVDPIIYQSVFSLKVGTK